MRNTILFAVVLSAIAAGTASPQSFPDALTKYLNLSDAQVKSISQINSEFTAYGQKQSQAYYTLQSQASSELAKDEPDPAAVGTPNAQMELLRRDYADHTAQVQSQVAALLSPSQVLLVGGLLQAQRLQPLVADARCLLLTSTVTGTTTYPCGSPSLALVNYLHLTSSQVIAINSAVQALTDYDARMDLQVLELDYQIDDLTAATPLDPLQLGAAYIARQRITRDEDAQAKQLANTVKSMINDDQQPLLRSLVDAAAVLPVAQAAACWNILVLPRDLQNNFSFNAGFPYQGSCYFYASISDSLLRPRGISTHRRKNP